MVGLSVFCTGIGLIIIGLVLCCFWVKGAESSRLYRLKREQEITKAKERYCPNVTANHALLQVPGLVSILIQSRE